LRPLSGADGSGGGGRLKRNNKLFNANENDRIRLWLKKNSRICTISRAS
jgi:hypothetical protein